MRRVLLVDDDIAEIAAVKRALARAGARAQLVTRAADALVALADPPALVVIASDLESGEGLRLARRLAAGEATRHLPLVLLGDPREEAPALVLQRPVDSAQLAEVVAGILDSSATSTATSSATSTSTGTAAQTATATPSARPSPRRGEGQGERAPASAPSAAPSSRERAPAAELRAAADALRLRAEELRRQEAEDRVRREDLARRAASREAEEALRQLEEQVAPGAVPPSTGPLPDLEEELSRLAEVARRVQEERHGEERHAEERLVEAAAPDENPSPRPSTPPREGAGERIAAVPADAPDPESLARAEAEEAARRRAAAAAREKRRIETAVMPPEPAPRPPREAAPPEPAPEPAQAAVPPELARGSLSVTSPARLLAAAARARLTGRMDFEGSFPRSLYFEEGRLAGAASGAPGERVEDVALRLGLVTRDQHRAAAPSCAGLPTRRAALALLERGFLKPEELTPLVRRRAEEILFSLFAETGATWRHAKARVPPEERVALDRSAPALAVEGVRRRWQRDRLEEVLGGAATLLTPAAGPATDELGLSEQERRVARLADGLRTLDEIVAESPLDDFSTRQLLAALVEVGALEVRIRAQPAAPGAAAIDRERLAEKLEQVRRADYFTILGLSRAATPYEIRSSAERLLAEFDPARWFAADPAATGQVEEVRRVVGEARDVLADDELRAAYLEGLA